MKRNVFILSLVSFLIVGLAFGKDFWEKKPYTKWSEKEARKMITKSPWTYEFQYGRIGDIGGNIQGRPIPRAAQSADQSSSIDIGGASDSEREYITYIHISLFSSRPIRQAFVSLLADGNKKKLERFKDFATRDINDEVIVSWTIDSKPKGVQGILELRRQLDAASLAELKNDTFLATDSGRKVYIKDYRPPSPDGTGAKFIFPKIAEDGKPLLTPQDKSLRFQTKKFRIGDSDVAVDATFKVKDMMFDGKLEY